MLTAPLIFGLLVVGVKEAPMDQLADLTLQSPSKQITVTLRPGSGTFIRPRWSAEWNGKPILADCELDIDLKDGGTSLRGRQDFSTRRRSVNKQIPVLFGKASKAADRYEELRLDHKRGAGISIVFRCYDDAIAFRYEIKGQGLDKLVIEDEGTTFGLVDNPTAYVQYLENHKTSHEHNVATTPYEDIRKDTLLDLPLTLQRKDGVSLAITEASLRKYAGMALMSPKGEAGLECRLTPKSDGTKVVTNSPAVTPWRVVLIGDRPGALLESNTIYCLNEPSVIKDTSWIKPGKMTWPWWNGHLYEDKQNGESILSIPVISKYIDFCAENGILYHSVVSDEKDHPWYVQKVEGLFPGPGTDVTKVREGLDLPLIRKMAEGKGIKLWTWVHQATLKGRVEEAFAAFEKMGWSGMMVDFFDHDDQENVEFAEEILAAAARHKILIHLHGVWKPTGLQRTYPNLMNHEGALNLEFLKWGDLCPPEHDLMMSFTRLIAGPMDYHLGGFRAVKRPDFKPQFVGPNVLGTRCHQLAMFVCFDNPQPMVGDYPEAYRGQPGFDFLRRVPTYWDETRILHTVIGRVLVTARRKGKDWYVGCLAAGRVQPFDIPLSFLPKGNYDLEAWSDTPESNRLPNQIGRMRKSPFSAKDVLRVRPEEDGLYVAEDGGFVAVLKPSKK